MITTMEQRYPTWNGLTEREQARLEALDECRRICQRTTGSACYSYVDAIEHEIEKLIGEIVPLDEDDEPLSAKSGVPSGSREPVNANSDGT